MIPGQVDEIMRLFKEKTGAKGTTTPQNPVILLPGMGASGLEALLDRVRRMRAFLCFSKCLIPHWRKQPQNGIALRTGIGMRFGLACILNGWFHWSFSFHLSLSFFFFCLIIEATSCWHSLVGSTTCRFSTTKRPIHTAIRLAFQFDHMILVDWMYELLFLIFFFFFCLFRKLMI